MKQRTRPRKSVSHSRQFTRKDVEDYFNTIWGAIACLDGDTLTIKEIALLPEITPPSWRVEYCIDNAAINGFHYHNVVLIIQDTRTTLSGDRKWYLTAPSEQPLPVGCASVKEEDAWLRQQRCAGAAQEVEGANGNVSP